MTRMQLRTTEKVILVDCTRALENGVSSQLIIKRMEQCVDAEYFQDWKDWEYNEYPHLKLIQDKRRICGSKDTSDHVLRMNWYQLEPGPSDIQKKLVPDNDFKEDLL